MTLSRCLPSLYLSAWKLSWKTGATGQWESARSHAFLLGLNIPTLNTNWRPEEQQDLVWVPSPCCISFLPHRHTYTHIKHSKNTHMWMLTYSPRTQTNKCEHTLTDISMHADTHSVCIVHMHAKAQNHHTAAPQRSHKTWFSRAETLYEEVSYNIRPVVLY